ncbi:unnamed protein product [Pleuronectes platessa]|uniref:Uncharacterized protein n=1 Tax=Pleuronectes platessa TaxID=8262 RepID=A0A9N7TQT0_PLEPL|nr:unnamed protein product [Pleuronectes platessa]
MKRDQINWERSGGLGWERRGEERRGKERREGHLWHGWSSLGARGSWGPLDRRQPSRDAETITQHQIQCTEDRGMEGDEEKWMGAPPPSAVSWTMRIKLLLFLNSEKKKRQDDKDTIPPGSLWLGAECRGREARMEGGRGGSRRREEAGGGRGSIIKLIPSQFPLGANVKPNQCLVCQRCSSPRHRLTIEASRGRHTSHFQSASSGPGLRAGGRGEERQCPSRCVGFIEQIRLSMAIG